jgi:hypothetical protein
MVSSIGLQEAKDQLNRGGIFDQYRSCAYKRPFLNKRYCHANRTRGHRYAHTRYLRLDHRACSPADHWFFERSSRLIIEKRLCASLLAD